MIAIPQTYITIIDIQNITPKFWRAMLELLRYAVYYCYRVQLVHTNTCVAKCPLVLNSTTRNNSAIIYYRITRCNFGVEDKTSFVNCLLVAT